MDNEVIASTDLQVQMVAAVDGPGVDPETFAPTDAGNALLFIALNKENVRYVEPWRQWAWWDDSRWRMVSDTVLVTLARQVTEYMFAWAATLVDDRRQVLRKHAMASQREARLYAMINLAKGEPSVRAEPSQFDANPWLLGCENVTVNLRKKDFYQPRRKDLVTKSTGVVFDMSADCPNWIATLDWAFQGDAATIEHVQRIAGYALTGDVSEEKLFAFFGGGGNGKTTIVATLLEALGDYSGKAPGDLLVHPQGEKGAASPDIAALHGKRLVVVSETDEGCSIAEAQVKAITSNEPVAARRLHRDPFTFMPTHKTLLMTNYRPFVKGTDDGIWRRLDIVEFKAQIGDADKDPHFRETYLRPELPGILDWMIKGCFKWQRDGLKPSIAVERAIKVYRREMDFIQDWLDENTVTDPQAIITRSEAYGDYVRFSNAQHTPTLGNRRFLEELRRRGYGNGKRNGVRCVRGFRLKPWPALVPAPTLRVVGGTAAKP